MVAFDKPNQAQELRLQLQNLQSEYLLDLVDLVVAVRDKAGKVKLQHADNLIADDLVFQIESSASKLTAHLGGVLVGVEAGKQMDNVIGQSH